MAQPGTNLQVTRGEDGPVRIAGGRAGEGCDVATRRATSALRTLTTTAAEAAEPRSA